MSNTTGNPIADKRRYDIHEGIYDFIVRVIKLVNSLPKTSSNSVISQQLLRCATSIGANDQEADGTLTKKDFIHCYTVVRKETKETNFWLKLIGDTNPTIKPKMGPIIQEGHEIAAIISSIINNARAEKILPISNTTSKMSNTTNTTNNPINVRKPGNGD